MSEATARDQTEEALQRKAIKTGRSLVLAVIAYTMCLVILDKALYGADQPGYAVFNTLWSAFLCICLYRRANWARWILSILMVLSSLLLAYFSFPYFSVSIVLNLAGILIPIVLFSPAVGAYFRAEDEDFITYEYDGGLAWFLMLPIRLIYGVGMGVLSVFGLGLGLLVWFLLGILLPLFLFLSREDIQLWHPLMQYLRDLPWPWQVF